MNTPATDPSSRPASRRLRPRFLPTITTIAAIVLFVAAGNWQHNRMEQKQAMRAQFDAASAAPPAALPREAVDWNAWRYRPVQVDGVFDAARQILVDNKIEGGRAGFHVVTPLLLADGRAVLVDRGWVVAGETRAKVPAVAPPSEPVTVHGRVNVPTPNYVELTRDAHAGVIWENLDPVRFSAATGLAVLPVVVEQTAPLVGPTVAGDTLVRNWPAPDFGIERHRIYMVQWLLFAATAAGLWLFFNLRRAPPKESP
jgi:surfeit locus 1 family protein